jgi:hypothetical protein
MCLLSAALAGLTAVYPDWIEATTNVHPDAGNGALEWLIVLGFSALAVLLGLRARTHRAA